MIERHISELVRKAFLHDPTDDQSAVINALSVFITRPEEYELMIIKGFSGTGKTSLIAALVRTLPLFKIPVVLLAPTGRAAKVLSQYAGMPSYTIHKKIYRQKSSTDGFGDFVPDRNLASNTLFIVDEASMIGTESMESGFFGSGNLLQDLVRYVYNGRNCHLIVIGDTAQLPPVGTELSPALDAKAYLQFDLEAREISLRQVVRQEKYSGILENATRIRQMLDSSSEGFPALSTREVKDVTRVTGQDIIETISMAYDRDGIEDTIVICRSNKQANRYNAGIRNQILGREEELSGGDILMVVKNNYFWLREGKENDFIANGDILKIKRIRRFEDRYGLHFADITAVFPDYDGLEMDVKVMLDTLTLDAPSLPQGKNKEFYQAVSEDYTHLTSRKKQLEAIRSDPFFNALQVKFAYAVTCHKAQGGQWNTVFIDQGWIEEKSEPDRDYLRWLYTAFTRAINKVYLVNFMDRFFPGE
ncbi:MAG: AAA family ATPase [Bacteroidales bacterium]